MFDGHALLLERPKKRYKKQVLASREQLSCETLGLAQLRTEAIQKGVAEVKVNLSKQAGCFCCNVCGQIFASRGAWGSHRAKVHHLPSEVVGHVGGTECQVCLTQFHTTSRLHRHLRYNQACLSAYQGSDICGGPKIKDGGVAWKPCAKICGPRPFWAGFRPELVRTQVDGGQVGHPAELVKQLAAKAPLKSDILTVAHFVGDVAKALCYSDLSPHELECVLEELPLGTHGAIALGDALKAISLC